MRMSRLFGVTLRKPPAEADTPGHGYLLRAGYIRAVAPGIFSYPPLGLRSLRKIEAVLREELNSLGGQEIAMSFVQPQAIWERSGRLSQAGDELVRCHDRGGRELVIGATHEEVAAELARANVRSYRDLPVVLFQIRPAFRDEARPHSGLLRARVHAVGFVQLRPRRCRTGGAIRRPSRCLATDFRAARARGCEDRRR